MERSEPSTPRQPVRPAARLEACLSAIGAHEQAVRAFRHLDIDAAKWRTGELEAQRDRGEEIGALAGRVIGLKDIIETAGMPTRYGSPIYEDHQPAASAPIAVLIAQNDGVLIGKTETTEFAWLTPTRTRNPVDTDYSPGGSSSGSAAAVAAGMLDGAVGTQTGGSVIRPAAFCGVVGYKPSFDLIPAVGVKTFSWTLDTIGTFAREVSEAALLAGVLSGRNLVPTTLPRAPRLGVFAPEGGDADAYAALQAVREAAEAAGAVLLDLEAPPAFGQLDAAWRVINDWEGARSLGHERRAHPDGLSEGLRQTLDMAAILPEAAHEEALATAATARAQLPMMIGGCDAILTLSAPGRAPLMGSTGDSRFNRLWTLLGTPAVSVPVPEALRGGGLPLGVQIVAPRLADRTALSVSAWVERMLTEAA
ncbi:MAG: amidase [Pseudomonadota bacterium]